MASLSWIEAALPGLLPCLWVYAGLGLPWAFAAAPRRDWQSRPLIAALALALGPAWLTAWMLALGLLGAQLDQPMLTTAWIMPGSLVISLLGIGLAWRRRQPAPTPSRNTALAADEKLIIALIIIALALRWLHTAYFPFTAYDALWVFGYQGRLFALEGMIPNSIDYYPPFLSLQFAFVQILTGAINDHAARMILPFMHIGGILAAYLLGQRLLNRRVGLIVAALWSLHPFVGQWSFRGDLELTLSFTFTLAALFLLEAWRESEDPLRRRHNAILAGIMLGIALFTKPTAGAFIWGLLLLIAFELLRARGDIRRCLPRLQVALWTGLACLPLGAVWYARNILLGHEAVTLPKAVWLTRALRSGDYLAPLLLLAALVILLLMLRRGIGNRQRAMGMAGLLMMLAGALASNATLFPARVDPPASYIQPVELLMMLAGLGLAAIGLRPALTTPLSGNARRELKLAIWALLLAMPYFLTYFFSYSYHYRLGFAILPLLCLPSAMLIARILPSERIAAWRASWRRAYLALLALLCLPGLVAVTSDVNWSSIWLLRDDLPGDFEKYQHYNPSLMQVVAGLRAYSEETDSEPVVFAPGEERLPFFFPRMRIHDGLLSSLDELEELGATHVVYGAKAREAYQDAGLDPARTQLIAALGRRDLFEKTRSHYQGVFSYELYEIGDHEARRQLPQRFAMRQEQLDTVVFGGQLQLFADGLYPPLIFKDMPITFEPAWRALQPMSRDYQFVLQVRYPSGEYAHDWRFVSSPHRQGAYQTSLWSVGEIVNDVQVVVLPRAVDLDDSGFTFWLGVWDAADQAYLPLTVNDIPSADPFHRLPGSVRFEG